MAQLKSTSVTGNLSVTGNVLASKIAKQGGTNTEILLADGSTTPFTSLSDTKVKQEYNSTDTNKRPLLISANFLATQTSGSSDSTTYWNSQLAANLNTGALYAKTFYENGTSLSSLYLGKTAKAASATTADTATNATKLGGVAASSYALKTDIVEGSNYYHTPIFNSGLKIADGSGVAALYVPIVSDSTAGLMSAVDKENLDTIVNSFNSDDSDATIETVKEVIKVFNAYPAGTSLATALAAKADKTSLANKADKSSLTTLEGIVGTMGDDLEQLSIDLEEAVSELEGSIPVVNNGTLTIQKNGTNVATFSANQNGNVTANITVPTYESKAAASGGTAVSLVTTGEKYTWNNKSNLTIGTTSTTAAAGNHTHTTTIAESTGTNQITLKHGTKYAITAGGTSYVFTMPTANTGDITGVTAGTGLTGGGASGSVTVSANLNSTGSLGTIGTTSKLYAVGVDAKGKLCVSVPWQNTTSIPTRLAASSTSGYDDANKALEQGWHYMSSTATNRPPFYQVDGQTGYDYRIMTTAYGSTWLQQIATDFRSNDVFTRRCQNGTWQSWTALVKMPPGERIGTDNAIARWDASRNATIQDSKVTIDDNGVLNAPTLQEGGTSLANKYLTGITKAMVTTALGYTPPTSDTNTWRPVVNNLTSTATDSSLSAAQGKALNDKFANYVTLNGAQTISGAKTHTALIKTAENTMGLKLRTHDSYETGWVYGTSGNEAITLAMQNPVTAFQIVYGTKPSSFAGGTWQTVTPLFQTKDGKVIINRKIAATADTSSLKLFDVNGDAAATTFYENGTSLANKYQAKGNYLTGITKAMVTTALGYTPPTSDTNTTYSAGTGLSLSTSNAFSVSYGKTAGTACQGNDSRLSDSRNAKDVYSWAKASTKPSYTASEVGALSSSGGNVSGHIYLTGSKASSSTGNTSQIVFGTSSDNHIVLSSNDNALVINPTTSTTTNQIVLYLDKQSQFPSGITSSGTINAATLQEGGTSLSNKYFPKANIKVKGTSVSTLDLREGTNISLTKNSDGTVSISSTASGGSGLTEGGSLNSATIGDFYCKYINDSTASGTSSAYVETGDLIYCVNTYASQNWVTQNFVKKCLLEDTLITMADGSSKRIEEVKEGDLVKSIDIQTGKETQAVVLANNVGDVENFYYMMMFEDGSSLKTNWTHDIYNATKGTWAKSDCDMYLDDEVIKENGTRTKFIGTIDTIGTTGGKRCNFYDIVVSNNCYYADGILCSHNPITQYRWLIPALNKYAKDIPQELVNIIATYRDEDSREADLVHNNAYMAEYIPQMAAKMKKEAKMRALKTELANTDYVTLKVSEGVEITPEIQEKLDARAWWRKLYNEHEAEINVIYQNIDRLKVKYSPLGEDILLPPMELRKKFFLESCKKGNASLNKFKEYYRNSDKFQVDY